MKTPNGCIHPGKKTNLSVEYDGIKQTLQACDECIEIVKGSNLCKVLEVID